MSTLIISNNKTKALKYIVSNIEKAEKCSINILNNVDILYHNDNVKNLSTSTIRSIITFIDQKSLNLSKKYVIISNFNRSSIEAQNTFLKTLEENNNEIYLISKNLNGILPTVISRVFIKDIEQKFTYNKKILAEINAIYKGDLSKIKNLSKNFDLEKVLNNLEYFIYRNKDNLDRVKIQKILTKIYKCKNQILEVKLNSEIQLTSILLELF